MNNVAPVFSSSRSKIAITVVVEFELPMSLANIPICFESVLQQHHKMQQDKYYYTDVKISSVFTARG